MAEDVFVPEHRSMPTRLLFEGESPHGEIHATHINRLPVLVCLGVQFAGAITGIAERRAGAPRGAHPTPPRGLHRRPQGRERRHADAGGRVGDRAPAGEGRWRERAADRCDEVAVTGQRLTIEERAELKWHAAYVAELCRRATERIFASAGAHAIYDDSVLQARFRDVNTACHHAVADFDDNAQMYGRVAARPRPGHAARVTLADPVVRPGPAAQKLSPDRERKIT